jgi:hypothetical protein
LDFYGAQHFLQKQFVRVKKSCNSRQTSLLRSAYHARDFALQRTVNRSLHISTMNALRVLFWSFWCTKNRFRNCFCVWKIKYLIPDLPTA